MTRRGRLPALLLATAWVCQPIHAQRSTPDPAAANQLGAPHELLDRLAGDYVLTTTFWASPTAAPEVSTLPAARRVILDGRALETKVGPDASGFHGAGHMGFDNLRGDYWYTWADTTTTGLSLIRGSLDENGEGTLSGETPTPWGYVDLRVEIRYEGTVEIHDYWVPGESGDSVRIIEHRYVPADG